MIALFEDLGRELQKHGVKVRHVQGWRDRGRDGTWAPRGVLFHHTASNRRAGNAPALGICTHGRSDLPGPLCQLHVSRDGTVTLVAAGRANHAGLGGPIKGIPQDSGNAYLVGVECENDGIGEDWPEKQKDAIATLYAVLLLRMKRTSAFMLIAHKEYTSRKIDPAGIDMKPFRKRTRRKMREIRRDDRRRRRNKKR